MDNTLTYLDQASFLALRALGRQPLVQLIWIYDRPVDIDGLRRFQHNLRQGLLGRHIERSALPFGRHHWVRHDGPAAVEVATAERPRHQAWEWVDERASIPVDPEFGPAWHLGVQPFSDGGAAVTLVISHSVADLGAAMAAIIDAGEGNRRDLGYPAPGARSRKSAVKQDLKTTLRSVPDIGRAVAATARLARTAKNDVATSMNAAATRESAGQDVAVVAPTATVWIDVQQWDRRAAELGGTSNSLFAGLAARLGQVMGRVGADGRVLLSWPVSDRVEGDSRANALTAVEISADPSVVTTTLEHVRADFKAALTALPDTSEQLMAPLPLVPFTPRALVRRLEMMVGKIGDPVGCSNAGELDPAVNRPDGTDADRMTFRMIEPNITSGDLDRTGGYLYVGSARMHGQISLCVGAWIPGGPNTRDRVRAGLLQALDEMGLPVPAE